MHAVFNSWRRMDQTFTQKQPLYTFTYPQLHYIKHVEQLSGGMVVWYFILFCPLYYLCLLWVCASSCVIYFEKMLLLLSLETSVLLLLLVVVLVTTSRILSFSLHADFSNSIQFWWGFIVSGSGTWFAVWFPFRFLSVVGLWLNFVWLCSLNFL